MGQRVEARDAQPALRRGGERRGLAPGMADDVLRGEHDLREARLAHRAQLGLQRPRQRDGVHPEVIKVHLRSLCTSSNVTPPRYGWVSAPFSLGCTAPRATNTMPRACSARTAAGTSAAPRPTRTTP